MYTVINWIHDNSVINLRNGSLFNGNKFFQKPGDLKKSLVTWPFSLDSDPNRAVHNNYLIIT